MHCQGCLLQKEELTLAGGLSWLEHRPMPGEVEVLLLLGAHAWVVDSTPGHGV